MRHKLRIVARLSPAWLRRWPSWRSPWSCRPGCVRFRAATAPSTGREAAAVEPPPGGLVDSAPNFGWTPGEFSVSHDGAAQYTRAVVGAGGPRRGHPAAVAVVQQPRRQRAAGRGLVAGWVVVDLVVPAHDRAGRLHRRWALRRRGCALPGRQPAGSDLAAVVAAAGVPHRAGDLRPDHRLRARKTTCRTTSRCSRRTGRSSPSGAAPTRGCSRTCCMGSPI